MAIVGLVEQIKHHRRVNSSEYAVANGTIVDIKTEFRRKIAYKISDPTQSEYYTNNRGLIIVIVSVFCAVGIISAVVPFLGTGMFS